MTRQIDQQPRLVIFGAVFALALGGGLAAANADPLKAEALTQLFSGNDAHFTLEDRPTDGWSSAQWKFAEAWLLRGGFGYDSSPVDDDKRLPDIPVGEQFRFSVGLQHDFGEGKVFAISYTGLYSPMDVDGVALPPNGDVILSGEYDPAFISLIGFQLSLQF